MKYIFNELFDPWQLLSFTILASLWSFAPWVVLPFFQSVLFTVLGAYFVQIIWIAARTVLLTVIRKAYRDGDDKM